MERVTRHHLFQMSWSSSLLPELYAQIAVRLPIRSRINLKRACKQNYRWDRAYLYFPAACVPRDFNLEQFLDVLRSPFRNDEEYATYVRFTGAMQALLRSGWLDLIWHRTLAVTRACGMSIIPECRFADGGPPCFTMGWSLPPFPSNRCVVIRYNGRKWFWHISPNVPGDLNGHDTLDSLLSSIGIRRGLTIFSREVMFPPTISPLLS